MEKLIKLAGCASGTCPAVYQVAGCGSGSCPTVYADDSGDLVVQGAVVDPTDVGLQVPAGEQLVKIPASLIQDYLTAVDTATEIVEAAER